MAFKRSAVRSRLSPPRIYRLCGFSAEPFLLNCPPIALLTYHTVQTGALLGFFFVCREETIDNVSRLFVCIRFRHAGGRTFVYFVAARGVWGEEKDTQQPSTNWRHFHRFAHPRRVQLRPPHSHRHNTRRARTGCKPDGFPHAAGCAASATECRWTYRTLVRSASVQAGPTHAAVAAVRPARQSIVPTRSGDWRLRFRLRRQYQNDMPLHEQTDRHRPYYGLCPSVFAFHTFANVRRLRPSRADSAKVRVCQMWQKI